MYIFSPGALAAKAGLFDASKSGLSRRDHPLVDSNHPGLQSLPHLVDYLAILHLDHLHLSLFHQVHQLHHLHLTRQH